MIIKMGEAKASRRGNSRSLAERAYELIRENILRGKYPLGAALSRRDIARQLRMSFVPVSEALQRLEIDGLVESRPQVGTRVRIPTAEDVRERYVLREALESQSARLFAEKASCAQKKELREMAVHLDSLYAVSSNADGDFLHSVHAYHMKFHLQVADGADCKLLRDAIEREQVLVFNWLFDASARRKPLPAKFHSNLASALASSDVRLADHTMREHVRFGLGTILANLAFEPRETWRVRRARPTVQAG